MSWRFIACCLLPIIPLLAVVANAQEGEIEYTIKAPLLSTAPVLDGVIGQNEYGNSLFVSFIGGPPVGDLSNPGTFWPPLSTEYDDTDEDFSVTVHAGHTNEALYLGFRVVDDFLDQEDIDSDTPWENDAVELFIDADREINDLIPADRTGSFEGFQAISDSVGNLCCDRGDLTTGEYFTTTTSTLADGYVVEFKFPLEYLDTADGPRSEVPAKTGDVLRFMAAFTDNDMEINDNQQSYAMLWLRDMADTSPYGAGEETWVVGLELSEAVGAPSLQAGDADMDLKFDQLDLVRVQIAAKYLTGQVATWGEGDWNGAPGGSVGNPPAGDNRFDQLDIIAGLNAGKYLTGPYAAIAKGGMLEDGQTSIVYNASTGEVAVNSPTGKELTSVNIESASSIFTGAPAQNLGGSFDNDKDNNIFKATFGSSFGSLSFGNVAQAGLSEDFVAGDLTVVGSLAGGGALGNVDLVYVPEPGTLVLLGLGLLGLLRFGRRES